jgi:DNA repair protein RecO (recombination protein O)
MRIESERGYVLHQRPYRETSLLVDLFTCNYGRVRCIAKGFRKPNKKGISRALFPYTEYQFNWQGRGELKTLSRADVFQAPVFLPHESSFIGLYINEILYRLLHEHDPHQTLYGDYCELMNNLTHNGLDEKVLRGFEMTLLDELGYGLVLDIDSEKGTPILAERSYHYIPEQGLREVAEGVSVKDAGLKSAGLNGVDIIAICQGDYSKLSTIRTAKRLTRSIIDFYLDGRQLHSRELYRQYKSNKSSVEQDKAVQSGDEC